MKGKEVVSTLTNEAVIDTTLCVTHKDKQKVDLRTKVDTDTEIWE